MSLLDTKLDHNKFDSLKADSIVNKAADLDKNLIPSNGAPNHAPNHAPKVINFGCRQNIAESEEIEKMLIASKAKSTVVFNGCAVTGEAEVSLRKEIRKERRKNPNAKLILTGCPATINYSYYCKMPELDLVVRNDEKLNPSQYGLKMQAGAVPNLLKAKTRSILPIQFGCDHSCTFCIIPKGRGVSESMPPKLVIDKVSALLAKGSKEIVFSGIDIGSWGKDIGGGWNLGSLLKLVLHHNPRLERLRISSIDGIEIDPDIMDIIVNDSRLMPHFHLSLQSGSDRVLTHMKRRHRSADILHLVSRIRSLRKDIALGADFIAGFPTETEDDFQDTIDIINKASIDYLHVFPFSPRPGTPAARIAGVPREEAIRRAKILREIGRTRKINKLTSYLGKTKKILLEQGQKGLTDDFIRVKLNGGNQIANVGNVIKVKILDIDKQKEELIAVAQ